MCSLDISQNQNGISICFSSRNSSQQTFLLNCLPGVEVVGAAGAVSVAKDEVEKPASAEAEEGHEGDLGPGRPRLPSDGVEYLVPVQGCQMAKFDCAPTPSTLAQSKERKEVYTILGKGSNFAA